MSIHPVGARVGAIQSADEDTVQLYGYGVYDGEHPPFEDMPGFKNPRITLDNGKQVWGMQCWWGSEEQIRNHIGDRDVIIVEPQPMTSPA